MKISLAICDDDAPFLDNLEKHVLKIADSVGCECTIKKLYSGAELINYCNANPVDIIITDIDMPDIYAPNSDVSTNTDGFTAAKQLQSRYPNIETVFVSSHEELAYQSFRYRPFSFISKRDLQMLDEDLGDLINKIKLKKSSNALFPLNLKEKTYFLNLDEIIYFKTDKHYILAHTAGRKDTSYRCGIKEVYEQLKNADFIFIHRSYLVNCRHIKYFDTRTVIMTNDEAIGVTRDTEKLKEAQEIFSRYKRRLR